MRISPLTARRIAKFKQMKRAYYSLWILMIFYGLSLLANFIANDQPLVVRYQSKFYFPVLRFYDGSHFGLEANEKPDYKRLREADSFKAGKGNFILFPLIPYGPNESLFDLDVYHPSRPTFKNLMGTDDRGRDILTRLIYGYRISFSFAILITCGSMILGIIIGAFQGYFGGVFDLLLQRAIEIFSTLPFLYVVMIIGSSLGTGFLILLLIFIIFGWIGISYYIRSEFLRLRETPYVEAAKAMGVSDWKIMFRHILPNALTPIVTFLPFSLIGAITSLSALDFLGFGLPAPTPSWGELMRQGMANLFSYWVSLFPVLALFIVLLLIAFVGEGIRDAFDPKDYQKME
ncbi:MAG TPA: ABC transporter permease [Bacillota bacterium]|nr:ABC transporter permease [Bacillota bacterium]HOL10440.1 ABC transporter permease [Bacillota bacterium]HPO98378.1 ABC transporter permease [Bacillota bacterium]